MLRAFARGTKVVVMSIGRSRLASYPVQSILRGPIISRGRLELNRAAGLARRFVLGFTT